MFEAHAATLGRCDGQVYHLALPLLICLIVVALAFDFLNGLHDAANSIATVVGTRLLSPVGAVAFAAFCNFAAYFLALRWPALHNVANTIGKGLIDKDVVTPQSCSARWLARCSGTSSPG